MPNVSNTDAEVQQQDKIIQVSLSQFVLDAIFHWVYRNYTAREYWKNLQEYYCPDPTGDLDDVIQGFWSFTVEDDIDID